ncbi:mst85C [Musca autumnalis]|uniref:mst85C n=1 Tax=Musca autumnalis TaxID=221902 RepID=UPI003CF7A6E7
MQRPVDFLPQQIPHQQQQQQMLLPNVTLQSPSPPATMPTPTTNWSMESMPWKIQKTDHTGDVMEFTAHTPHNNSLLHRAILHQKRKSEPVPAPFPVKQFISEEKITAHFNGLHISSDYIQHDTGGAVSSFNESGASTSGKCFSNLTYEDYQMTAKELEKKLLNANRITICEELKKINEQPPQHSVSCLPETLLHRLNKPCTALVLWQPPPPIINMLKQNTSQEEAQHLQQQQSQQQSIEDDDIPDLPPETEDEEIDDFVDNNNTCSLDFNHIKPDSMDEDM